MANLKEMREAQPSELSNLNGLATILAIGTANPSTFIYQRDFPDLYFRVTNSHHLPHLKAKLQRVCEKSMIEKRHVYLTEDILKQNPKLCAYDEPSLDSRQDMVAEEVPKPGGKAASKAIEEWRRPKSDITHLIFCSSFCGIEIPGADHKLIKLLGLKLSTKTFMLYHHGCYGGGTMLRLAKDIAENNPGARVLLVCSEITSITFRGPSETHLSSLVGQALYGDGAVAVVIGSKPNPGVERPLYHLVSASRMILPDSEGSVEARLREVGHTFNFKENVPQLIADNMEKSLGEAFSRIGISEWNSLFWIVHPGGATTLKRIEERVGLTKEKLRATKQVLKEYGNMSSACVLFILEEMRRKSVEQGKATTGEGLQWGVLHAYGPGLTTETLVLHSAPTDVHHA